MRTFYLAAVATLLAGSALAADLPQRTAPPMLSPVAPVFTWTGVNFGFLTSYAFSDRQTVRTVGNDALTAATVAAGRRPGALRVDADGFANIGGGIGYDVQLAPGNGVVIGAAADATWTDLNRRRVFVGPAALAPLTVTSVLRQSLDYLVTVRGRIGYGFDRFLVYGTGGFAFGDVSYRADFVDPFGLVAYSGRRDRTETGYVYGGGIEYAIPTDSFLARFNLLSLIGIQTSAITLKAEYLHYDLGSRNVLINNTGLPAAPGSYTSRVRTEGDIVRGGLTYRFSGF